MPQLFQVRMTRIAEQTLGYSRTCTASDLMPPPPPPEPQDPVPGSIRSWASAYHKPGDQIFAQWTTDSDLGDIITEWQLTAL